jgi:large subunit ribosomal protein L21
MYVVIVAGGKQYRVEQNSSILIEKQEQEIGSKLEFSQVLLASNGEQVFIGDPIVNNCIVKATVESHGKHDKVKILKFKRRKHHMKRMGHRQLFTKVKIDEISFN